MSNPLQSQVLAMLHEGHTSSAIAEALGTTRNVVCGIRHRAGGIQAFGRPPKEKRAAFVKHTGELVQVDRRPTVKGGGKQLEALGARDCRYPHGDPGSAGFHFCAKPRDGTGPYCAHHRILCTARRVTLDANTAGAMPL